MLYSKVQINQSVIDIMCYYLDWVIYCCQHDTNNERNSSYDYGLV